LASTIAADLPAVAAPAAVTSVVGPAAGPDVRDVDSNFDVVLISIHESREALATYQPHPAHVEVATWWGSLVAQRRAVDSEI
jgi:hypothetical protein